MSVERKIVRFSDRAANEAEGWRHESDVPEYLSDSDACWMVREPAWTAVDSREARQILEGITVDPGSLNEWMRGHLFYDLCQLRPPFRRIEHRRDADGDHLRLTLKNGDFVGIGAAP